MKSGKKSQTVSYGHDIEAAWLTEEAAGIIKNKSLLQQAQQYAVILAIAAIDGLDTDGGLWYEYDITKDDLTKEKHWWPQAEAMVGFFNAWQISRDSNYLQSAWNSWNFTKKSIRDQEHGEWVWGVHGDNSIMTEQDKAGIWKCPYHNGRACIELINRINQSISA